MAMIPIAKFGKIEILAKKDSLFSFYSSPYPAHTETKALDLSSGGKRYDDMYSPISGEIIAIKRIPAPEFSKNLDSEYVTAILPEKSDYALKIIHLQPSLEVGDYVGAGEKIGRLIRTQFFWKFNDPGIHLEIRKKDDLFRTSGGMEFEHVLGEVEGETEFDGVVTKRTDHYSIIELSGSGTSGDITGLVCNVDGKNAFLDCTYPWVDYGGIVGASDGAVFVNGTKIGNASGNIIQYSNFNVYVNDIKAECISSVLSLKKKAEIKIIPTVLKEGEKVSIEVKNEG